MKKKKSDNVYVIKLNKGQNGIRHRYRSSIWTVIWEPALNAAFGMKCIQYYYGIPTGTIAFWGIHVLRILTVDYTFKYHYNSIFGCAY